VQPFVIRGQSAALLYVLGYREFTMTNVDDSDDARMFKQFRRYVSMNLSALLE